MDLISSSGFLVFVDIPYFPIWIKSGNPTLVGDYGSSFALLLLKLELALMHQVLHLIMMMVT